jgi:hypothetical protein
MMKINKKLTFAALALAAGFMSFQQADAAPVSVNLGTLPGEATTVGTFDASVTPGTCPPTS